MQEVEYVPNFSFIKNGIYILNLKIVFWQSST